MAFLTENYVRQRATARARSKGLTVETALRRVARTDRERYDVFLSQTIKDREIVYGVYAILTEDLGLTVFCDWIEAPDTDRANVTPDNAHYIRQKLLRSDSLLFLDTHNVCIGAQTASRKYVGYEIQQSAARGNALLGVRIHHLRDQYGNSDTAGAIPALLTSYRAPVINFTTADDLGRQIERMVTGRG